MSENIINERTLVPVSLLIAIGSALIGGAVWLTAQDARGKSNAIAIKETRVELREDILRIEKKVDRLLELQIEGK